MTNEAKHTPGPWTIDRTLKYYKRPCIRHNGMIVAYLAESDTNLVRQYDGERAREQDEHNARLIATAPELLGALQLLLEAAEGINIEDGFVKVKQDRIDIARAAIAKALGK